MRFVARLGVMVATLGAALILHGLWRLVRARSPWPRLLLGAIGRIAGARVRVVGAPLRRDVLILANHQSWLDILVLAGASGAAFVAKDELRGVPWVGWLCTLNDTIFVARSDRAGIPGQVALLRAAVTRGRPVAIFPEGTTGDGRALLPFKAALLSAFDEAPPGIRIQPVAVDYGAATDAVAWTGDEPGASHATRLLGRRGTIPATLHFLQPIDPVDFPGRKAIAAEARRRIEAALPSLPNGAESR